MIIGFRLNFTFAAHSHLGIGILEALFIEVHLACGAPSLKVFS